MAAGLQEEQYYKGLRNVEELELMQCYSHRKIIKQNMKGWCDEQFKPIKYSSCVVVTLSWL